MTVVDAGEQPSAASLTRLALSHEQITALFHTVLLRVGVCAVLVMSCTNATPSVTTTRQSITVAYWDDPARAALVWGIRNGKVTSPTFDLVVSFVPESQAVAAVSSKTFDAVELPALTVPRSFGEPSGLVIVSAGLSDRAGTILVTDWRNPLIDPQNLRGKTIGVPSLDSASVEETRYLLAKKFGLDASSASGNVSFVEVRPEALLQRLADKKIDAAVLTDRGSYGLVDHPEVRILSRVSAEIHAMNGVPPMHTVLATYRDRADSQSTALQELQRLLRDSREYLATHRSEVLQAISKERSVDVSYLEWFFDAYYFSAGAPSEPDMVSIASTWEMARSLGQLLAVPRVNDLVFRP